MELELYRETRSNIDTLIVAKFNDGELRIRGHDVGPAVNDYWGMGNDYEYFLSLNKGNTEKLFMALGVMQETNKAKLDFIKDKFGGNETISKLSKYCKKNGIKTSFYSYP